MWQKIKNRIWKNKYTAVDFGHHSIKLVQAEFKKDKIIINNLDWQLLEPGVLENGRIADKSLASASLQTLLDRGVRRPGRIVFVPAMENIIVRVITIPEVTEDDLDETIRWEAEDYLPLPLEEVKLEYLTMDKEEGKQRVLLAVIPRDVLTGYEDIFSSIDQRPEVANLQDLAIVSLLNYQDKINRPSAIISMGASNMQVIIAQKNNIILSRKCDVGGNDFTNIFAENNMSWQEAEKKKQEIDLTELDDEVNDDELSMDLVISQAESVNSLENRINQLKEKVVAEVEKSLEYYSSQHHGANVEKIFFTGGNFLMQGLKDNISRQIDVDLERIDPFSDLTLSVDKEIDDAIRYRFAISVGLIISEVFADEN